MRNFLYILGTVVVVLLVGTGGWWMGRSMDDRRILVTEKIEKPLEKYETERLEETEIKEGELENLGGNLFEFKFDSDLDGQLDKKTTGQIRIPEGQGKHPIVVMFRGYVDQEIYTTGIGTSKAGEVFSKNGYITIAPDFLGYAGSDKEAGDIFESRFQTYVTALSLLASLDQVSEWDGENVFIWGHSNGGQVALTVLEIVEGDYPTTLWAPVTKPFPYSILYYTDESADKGKYIRRKLAGFEELYDVEKFSLTNYLDGLDGPIQLHQGTADDAVPVEWSEGLVGKLEKISKDITYLKYPGADHNLRPAWNTVVSRDMAFFEAHLKN